VRHAACRQITFHRSQNLSGELSAEFVVGVTAEPRAKVLLGLAAGQVVAQQALNRLRNQSRRTAITDGP
jgi:hypothetical protein